MSPKQPGKCLLRSQGEVDPKEPWRWAALPSFEPRWPPPECPLSRPHERFSSPHVARWLNEAGALLFSLPQALRNLTTPNHAVSLFAPDLHHLSARGHAFVAEGLWSTMRHAAGRANNTSTVAGAPESAQCDASQPGRFDRTAGHGSACFVWFGTGVVDPRLRVAAGASDETWALGRISSSGTKFAYMLTPNAVAARSEAALTLHFHGKAGAVVRIAFMLSLIHI